MRVRFGELLRKVDHLSDGDKIDVLEYVSELQKPARGVYRLQKKLF